MKYLIFHTLFEFKNNKFQKNFFIKFNSKKLGLNIENTNYKI